MKRYISLMLVLAGMALLTVGVIDACYTPASWSQLQQWAAVARPGEVLQGNRELAKTGGCIWSPMHTQTEPIKFLYSDSPEYLGNSAVGKGLAYMRLTYDSQYRRDPGKDMRFGIGLNHINHAAGPQTLGILIRLVAKTQDGGQSFLNTHPATVRISKGAYGVVKQIQAFAGKQCAVHWFSAPNVPPMSCRLAPGEARLIFARTLQPDQCMNAMFDVEASNAYFVKVYVIFGNIRDDRQIAFAPYELTIGTNSGTGAYWKRLLRPQGVPVFDAANERRSNKTHFRFETVPPAPGMQYLVDETWNLRPENAAKELIRKKGGLCRPFKGDYNVEYTVTIPVRSSTGKPGWFAVVDTQRYGTFTGAIKTATGGIVEIPNGPTAQVHCNVQGEGALLDRACVASRTPTDYTFHWLLPGGSYGDQEFMLVPLKR